MLRVALIVMLALVPASAVAGERPLQHVLISFDGAGPITQWEQARALARRTGAHFTFFLSCSFLLTQETKSAYRGPEGAKSNVGWAASRDDVAARLRQIWTARLEGHEIASHGCGHLDGGKWSAADWTKEIGAFRRVVTEAWALNGVPYQPKGWRAFASDEIVGFRAPYLSAGHGLDKALLASGFTYDASTVSRLPEFPENRAGLARFALPMIPEGPDGRRILAMDYNLFVRHSGGFERVDKEGAFEERAYLAFKEAFDAQAANGAPLQIGLHFTLMNGGAYWRALERFAGEVCGRRDVRCISYKDYLRETVRRPS